MLKQFETRIQTLTAANESKQSEIDSKQSQIESLEANIQILTAANQSQIDFLTQRNQSEIESLRAEVERLSVRSPSQPTHSHPSHIRESDIQTQVAIFIHTLHV